MLAWFTPDLASAASCRHVVWTPTGEASSAVPSAFPLVSAPPPERLNANRCWFMCCGLSCLPSANISAVPGGGVRQQPHWTTTSLGDVSPSLLSRKTRKIPDLLLSVLVSAFSPERFGENVESESRLTSGLQRAAGGGFQEARLGFQAPEASPEGTSSQAASCSICSCTNLQHVLPVKVIKENR